MPRAARTYRAALRMSGRSPGHTPPHTWAADHCHHPETRPVKSLHQLLRSERGDLLLESMFAAVLLAIVLPSSATLIFAASASATAADSTISRTSLLNSVLTDETPRAGSYATPAIVQRQLLGKTVQVAVWTENGSAGGTLHAAMPKDGGAPDACSNPAALDPSRCLTSSAALPAAAGVVVKNVLTPGTAGALYDLTAPAGATELRYVFKAASVPADSEVVFGNRDHPEAAHNIHLTSGQAGYYYGRILVTGGDRLTVSTTGPATFEQESFTVYEAPR
jgi:hypothetical protein